MERIIWLLTFVPASMLLVVTGGIDFYLLTVMQEKGILENSILGNTSFLVTIAVIVLIAAIVFAVIGGRIGFKYVEMGRSRRWHYRANKYDDYNDQLRNTFIWAGKFACFPIIAGFILVMACELYYLM
jgi:hypothetical protein